MGEGPSRQGGTQQRDLHVLGRFRADGERAAGGSMSSLAKKRTCSRAECVLLVLLLLLLLL